MSVSYPQSGIGRCLELARRIWDKEKRTSVSRDVLATAMGYGSLNGAARTQLSALKQFGLIESDSTGTYRLSDLAVELMAHPVASIEYHDALERAALKPDLFREIQSAFAQASDEAIRAHLITKRGFSDGAARGFIRSFRETLRVAKSSGTSRIDADMPNELSSARTATSTLTPRKSVPSELDRMMASKTADDLWALGYPPPTEAEHPATNELRLNISRDTRARIIFSGPVTQEAIEKLAALLELQKDTFPLSSELALTGSTGDSTLNEDSGERTNQ